jgi:hypothetical protein
MAEPSKVGLRLRSARAKAKGRAILTEVFEAAETTRAVLIAGNRDGSNWTVVPVGMMNRDLAEAMLAGAHAVQRMLDHEKALAGHGQPVRIEVSERGDGPRPDASAPIARETRVAANGTLEAPEGETFMFCGACSGSRWYATVKQADGYSRRLVCVGCGNEIGLHAITHGRQGHA